VAYILVVDDSEFDRRMIMRALKRADKSIDFAELNNGSSVVDTLRLSRPDLILLDIRMPGPSGFEVLDTIKGGISVLKTQKIDLILLDDKMQDGLTAQQSVPQLREIADDISMILISSSINADYLKDKTILDVYDIVDKFHLRSRIREGLLQ